MKWLISKAWKLGSSKTAQNTYVLFSGNLVDAILAFLFTVLAFRVVTTSEFGTYSAINNMAIILYSLLDLGVGGGLINFISQNLANNNTQAAQRYFRAGLQLRSGVSGLVAIAIIVFSPWIGPTFFKVGALPVVLGGINVLGLSVLDVLIFSLQAHQRFLQAAITSSMYSLSRVLLILSILVMNNPANSLTLMAISALAPWLGVVLGAKTLNISWWPKTDTKTIKSLMSFSGWVGVTRLFGSLAARLDVQMILLLAGAFQAGIYSVAARLASFYGIIVTSFSSVLAPRLASASSVDQIRGFIGKSTLAVGGLVLAMCLGTMIAHPFVVLLFGARAAESVPLFQGLTLANIPFVIGSLATSIIIYTLKKPKIMAALTFMQLVGNVVGFYILIPEFGSMGAVISMGIVNTLVMVVSWSVVAISWNKK